MSDILSNIPDVSNKGKVRRYIADTLSSYRKVGTRLHISACLALYHAAEYGDTSLLNLFHGDPESKDDGLKVNDRTALRVWCGKKSTVETKDADGNDVKIEWLGFRSKQKGEHKPGFYVKKGTEEYRKGLYDLNDMIEGYDHFMDKDVATKEEMTLEKILAYLAKVKDQVEKKAEKDDGSKIDIPQDIMAELSKLSALATAKVKATSATTH